MNGVQIYFLRENICFMLIMQSFIHYCVYIIYKKTYMLVNNYVHLELAYVYSTTCLVLLL